MNGDKVMSYGYKLIILLCICSVLPAGCADKDEQSKSTEFEIDKDFQRGPLTVHVRISKPSVTIAETIMLQLQASIQEDYEVKMPKIDPVLQSFGFLDFHDLGDRLDENNNLVKTYNYKLEPLLSGNFTIPTLLFEFIKTAAEEPDQQETYKIETEPIDIEVTSLLGEDLAELVIADIADVVILPKKASLWPFVLIGLIILIAVIIVFVRLLRKRTAELIRIFKPAHQIAYQRLAKLIAAKLTDQGRNKEFYQRISDILRHYIEDRFNLRAPERTTEEFLFELGGSDILSGGDKDSLAEFLRHCDLVKFAKHQPTTEQIQKTFDLVKHFIEKTKSDQHQIDVTDAATAGQTVQAGGA